MEEKIKAVAVDANVFVALFNRDDALHQRAIRLWQEFQREPIVLYTSDLIVSEVLTVLRLKVGREAALRFGEIVFGSSVVLRLVYADRELTRLAYEIFSAVPVKDLSFADAMLIAMAKTFRAEVATFDKKLRNAARRY